MVEEATEGVCVTADDGARECGPLELDPVSLLYVAFGLAGAAVNVVGTCTVGID